MFLNFWWTYNSLKDKDLLRVSNEKAKEIGINPYDLYAGIDVQANGYKTPLRWAHYQRDDQAPFTSLGLYCPSWTYFDAKTQNNFKKTKVDYGLMNMVIHQRQLMLKELIGEEFQHTLLKKCCN